MRLTHITITGADDRTDPEEIRRCTEEFPFVEWGILVSETRFGSPRYPGVTKALAIHRAAAGKVAAHVCGRAAFRILVGDEPPAAGSFRTQLNGFTEFIEERGASGLGFGGWLTEVAPAGREIVLQVSTAQALAAAEAVHSAHANVSALWDQFGGDGRFNIDAWPSPGVVRLGYAGGLGPDTIERACAWVHTIRVPHEAWLDMESGVRTDDELDFDKVRRALETAQRFIVAA